MKTLSRIAEARMKKAHAAYTTRRAQEEWQNDAPPPSLRALAKRFGLPLVDVRSRFVLEGWELERQANEAKRWMDFMERLGVSLKSEAEFIEGWTRLESTVAADGEEGKALAVADARNVWLENMSPVFRWQAYRAWRKAKATYAAARDRGPFAPVAVAAARPPEVLASARAA